MDSWKYSRNQRCKSITCILIVSALVIVVFDYMLISLDTTSMWRKDFNAHYNRSTFTSLSDYLRQCGIQQPHNLKFLPNVDPQLFTTTPLTSSPGLLKKSFFERNLKRVLEYKFPIHNLQHYLTALHFDCGNLKKLEESHPSTHKKYPHLVTASSYGHFNELLVMLRHFSRLSERNIPALNTTVYDLGLSNLQLLLLKFLHPDIEVKAFPFENFPNHVKFLKGYTWKPIIIQLELNLFDFVMWADNSIRFYDDVELKDIDAYFENANKIGVQSLSGDGAFLAHTAVQMFSFLNENPNDFSKNGVQATFSMYRKNDFTQKGIMLPWVLCALTDGCMVSKRTGKTDIRYCHKLGTFYRGVKVGMCHRYDQSALGLILGRLFPHPMCDNIVSGPSSNVLTISRIALA